MTRSIRNFLATHNLLAVSANRQEPAINTEQELDTSLLADLNTVLNYQAVKVANREELTGKEEADRLHDFGGKVREISPFPGLSPSISPSCWPTVWARWRPRRWEPQAFATPSAPGMGRWTWPGPIPRLPRPCAWGARC